jgi:hypothetical protein
MKEYLNFIRKPDISPKSLIAHRDSQEKLKAITEKIKLLADTWTHGGSVTFNEMEAYPISTPENPQRFEAGTGCFIYRLPCSEEGKLKFYCIFRPVNGEKAIYGWHNHPDCIEETFQLEGTSLCNNVITPMFSTTRFEAGEYHNYSMEENGSILVTFTKVN